jgi:RNA polymerase sigma-70 factor (ECF subfamily)
MEPTDIELMLLARNGDAAAFQELVRRYREPLRRFFAALITDRSLADDFTQETFLRLWLSRQRYEPTGRFSTYLFQIGKNYWLNQRKKFANQPEESSHAGETLEIEAPSAIEPEQVLMEMHHQAWLRRAIAGLPEHYRLVFELSEMEGLKYAEIAQRLGIPLGTVKSRMSEAARLLRNALSKDEGE